MICTSCIAMVCSVDYIFIDLFNIPKGLHSDNVMYEHLLDCNGYMVSIEFITSSLSIQKLPFYA